MGGDGDGFVTRSFGSWRKSVDKQWCTSVWSQFGAAVDMLGQALDACPDELWRVRVWDDPYAEFWNLAHHALFWLDLYLSGSAEGFSPPPPITLDELDPAGRLPERVLTRADLRAYLQYARAKCRTVVLGLTDEQVRRICAFPWGGMPFVELQLYSMRHVQEHAAQLNLVLGQRLGATPRWIGRAAD
jgi:hypothetical protein